MSRYPNFTGQEPCASIGTEMYYTDDQSQMLGLPILRHACLNLCDTYEQCLSWSLEHEAHGFWAGMTAKDRERFRRKAGIRYSDPSMRLYPSAAVPDAS